MAIDLGGHLDLLLDAEHGFLEIEVHHVTQIGAAARALASTAPAEDVTENVAEDIAHVAETGAIAATVPATLEGRMTVLIVGRALLRVGEDVVGFLGFLEFLDRIRIVGVAIGVVLHRDATKGLLEVALRHGAFHTEDFVIVALAHSCVSQPLCGL